jgi:anti-sigma factor RsiW
MMKCPIESREAEEIFLAYASGRLDAPAAGNLEQHIAGCPACRGRAQGQQAVWRALDGWDAVPLSPDFDRRLYRRIESEVCWWDRLFWPVRPLLERRGMALAAAASLIVIAGLLLNRHPADTPVAAPDAQQVETLQPDQVERALDDLEMLGRFNRSLRAGETDSKI